MFETWLCCFYRISITSIPEYNPDVEIFSIATSGAFFNGDLLDLEQGHSRHIRENMDRGLESNKRGYEKAKRY